MKDLIGDVIGSNKTKTDSIKQQQDNTVKNVLNDIIKSKKTQDSTTTDGTKSTEKVIKNVLGGLLGRNKKEKDTVK